jgi:S-DNA-T family DNA segregation ATPase FtsK/SpoIIIE
MIDETYRKAIQIVVYEQSASTSLVQRHCSVGYQKGAAIIERMETESVISRPDNAGKRRVLWGLTDLQK